MTILAYTDGASRGNPGESGIGVILKGEGGEILYRGGGYIGRATNNMAEYMALLHCLKKAKEFNCSKLIVHSDSELMVRQVSGKYRIKNQKLREFFGEVQKILDSVSYHFTIRHVDREINRDADLLANIGIDAKRPIDG